jgi:signal transduction histidine kinase
MIATGSKSRVVRNLSVMTGFGIISIILGQIRFLIPGLDGGGSDMREIGILLSILFLPEWYYMLGVSFISSLSFPLHNLEVSTILMHCTASIFGWFFYSYAKGKNLKVYSISGLWALMVILYYVVFLIPTLVTVFYFFDVIKSHEIFSTYKNVLLSYRFEIFTTLTVTTLFLALYKISRILELKNRELEKALARSQESDRLKSAFINNINHELRTPLNGIVGFSKLLTDPETDSETRAEYSKGLISSSNRLLTMMQNIIDISKIETGQVKLKMEDVNLSELLDEIKLFYSRPAREKNLNLQIETDGLAEGKTVKTDRALVKQILDNLLNNALKFTKEGSVTVSCSNTNKLLTFSVKDTGPGIDPKYHRNIFDNFSKIENQNDEFLPGTGLGLPISKTLIDLLGGQIMLKSVPGMGSEFTFSIPVD